MRQQCIKKDKSMPVFSFRMEEREDLVLNKHSSTTIRSLSLPLCCTPALPPKSLPKSRLACT